jgi:hypothetical protein
MEARWQMGAAMNKPKEDWLPYFEEVTTLPEVRSPIRGLGRTEPATGLGRSSQPSMTPD